MKSFIKSLPEKNMQVALVCSVEAFPPATITWLQGGIQVRDMDMDRNKDRVRTMCRAETGIGIET